MGKCVFKLGFCISLGFGTKFPLIIASYVAEICLLNISINHNFLGICDFIYLFFIIFFVKLLVEKGFTNGYTFVWAATNVGDRGDSALKDIIRVGT